LYALRYMKPVIYSPGGIIAFQTALPKKWSGKLLAGSNAWYSVTEHGEVALQKFRDEDFYLSYADCHFPKKVELSWTEGHFLRLQFIMEGRIEYRAAGKLIKLRAGQVNAVWAPGRKTTASFAKGSFKMFQVAFSADIVQELLPDFPEAKHFPVEHLRRWFDKNRNKAIDAVLTATYTGEMLRFYYKTVVREFLFFYSQPASRSEDKYPEHIRAAIQKVDLKILEDPNKYYTTKDLADLAKLSETILVKAYKDIIGTSMFERYKDAKLERALRYLMETDEQIKVIYKLVGYGSISGFVEAFTARFGISPRRYRKKHRPF
jgi:AraC-like DNA-binding protein